MSQVSVATPHHQAVDYDQQVFKQISFQVLRRRGSVVRTSDLNAVDLGLNPVLTTAWICLRVTLESNPLRLVNSQLVCLLPVGVLNCIYL